MPTEERNAFFRYIGESQAACQAILKAKPGDRDARYFLSSAYGALAAFALTVDHDKREAFRQGKQPYQHHLRIVEEQPDYWDEHGAKSHAQLWLGWNLFGLADGEQCFRIEYKKAADCCDPGDPPSRRDFGQ
jgi:hypothetical protein